jgi:hypothetical protein
LLSFSTSYDASPLPAALVRRYYLSSYWGLLALALNPMMRNAPAGTEIILLELVALLATVATIWCLLYAIKTYSPDELKDPQFLSILLLVIIPFVMLIYFGAAVMICSEIVARSGRPTLPTELSLRKIVPLTVTYVGVSAWVWLRWRKV